MNPERQLIFADLVSKLSQCLTKRELLIICVREYGYTLQEIGDTIGVSRIRISQIEQKGYRRMRKRCRALGVRPERLFE